MTPKLDFGFESLEDTLDEDRASAAGCNCGRYFRFIPSAFRCHLTTTRVMATKTLDQRIASRPGVLDGKPCVAGRRIAVEHIVVWHERLGHSADEIAGEYDLELADVYAALAYYFAHREEIDQSMQEGEAFVRRHREQTPSLLEEKRGRSAGSG